MRAIWTIAKREIQSFYGSTLAYVVLTVWSLCMGFYFWLLAWLAAGQPTSADGRDALLRQFFGGTSLFYFPVLIFVPLLTMRLLAEESRTGTMEALLTAPVSEASVVLGKYLAALLFWASMWVPTFFYVWHSSRYGRIDLGAMASTYLGLFLLGMAWIGLGLLMSAVSKHPMISAMLTFLVLVGHFMIGLGQFVATDDVSRAMFENISVWSHLQAYASGIVDTRYLVWDLGLSLASVYLAYKVLELRRYEG